MCYTTRYYKSLVKVTHFFVYIPTGILIHNKHSYAYNYSIYVYIYIQHVLHIKAISPRHTDAVYRDCIYIVHVQ